jgi:hypothetical protein
MSPQERDDERDPVNDPANDVRTSSASEDETPAEPPASSEPQENADDAGADQTVTRPPFGGDETVTSPRFVADETVVHPRSELFGFGTAEPDETEEKPEPPAPGPTEVAESPSAEESPLESESAPRASGPEPGPESDVFSYGDRTIFQLRAQAFAFESEYGTMMSASSPAPSAEGPAPPPESEPPAQDPIARLEQKLDLALRQIALLQQKIESIDATLARALNR